MTTSRTYSASSSAFFFATIPCQGFVSLHAALAHSMQPPTWNGPLHLLLLQLEPAELNCIKVPLEVRKTNCEAHLIFSLCFGCLWLVLCQIRPEGPSKAVHVAILLFLFDPFSSFFNGSLLYFLRLESPHSSTCISSDLWKAMGFRLVFMHP